jgi:hypothetical protein
MSVKVSGAARRRNVTDQSYQYPANHGYLERGWEDMEHHGCKQKAYALCASINGARKASRLTRQVEVKIQSEQMLEDIRSHFANGFLGDPCEYRVAQFLGYRGADSSGAIYNSVKPLWPCGR